MQKVRGHKTSMLIFSDFLVRRGQTIPVNVPCYFTSIYMALYIRLILLNKFLNEQKQKCFSVFGMLAKRKKYVFSQPTPSNFRRPYPHF